MWQLPAAASLLRILMVIFIYGQAMETRQTFSQRGQREKRKDAKGNAGGGFTCRALQAARLALVPTVSSPLDHREGGGGVQHFGITAQVGCYQHLLNAAIRAN